MTGLRYCVFLNSVGYTGVPLAGYKLLRECKLSELTQSGLDGFPKTLMAVFAHANGDLNTSHLPLLKQLILGYRSDVESVISHFITEFANYGKDSVDVGGLPNLLQVKGNRIYNLEKCTKLESADVIDCWEICNNNLTTLTVGTKQKRHAPVRIVAPSLMYLKVNEGVVADTVSIGIGCRILLLGDLGHDFPADAKIICYQGHNMETLAHTLFVTGSSGVSFANHTRLSVVYLIEKGFHDYDALSTLPKGVIVYVKEPDASFVVDANWAKRFAIHDNTPRYDMGSVSCWYPDEAYMRKMARNGDMPQCSSYNYKYENYSVWTNEVAIMDSIYTTATDRESLSQLNVPIVGNKQAEDIRVALSAIYETPYNVQVKF